MKTVFARLGLAFALMLSACTTGGTGGPVPFPSAQPTVNPSPTGSAQPQPSASPADATPTPTPTGTPSAPPSAIPSASAAPSRAPSPTASPLPSPTVTTSPSAAPTASPSAQPTAQPTASPTVPPLPTPTPTRTPTAAPSTGAPNFGSNVVIFDPSMSSSSMQSTIDTIANQQFNNQFGSQRYALLFKPGSYNVNINVNFFMQVLGLGQSPDNVTLNGTLQSIPVLGSNNATQNFWRSVENVAIVPPNGTVSWAVSQACPMRRTHVKGNLALSNNGWASGGYLGDSLVDGQVRSGTQQQWISRNDQWGSWTGSNWNMVFVGTVNAPGNTFPNPPYTTAGQTPVVREKPFLTIDSAGNYSVFVPALRNSSQGTSWSGGAAAGTSIPLSQFYIAQSSKDNAGSINAALSSGKNLLLTPGVYNLSDTLRVNNPNTIVLGLGLATLHPTNGLPAMTVADVDGVEIGGVLFDAGATNSPTLLQVGPPGSSANHGGNPTILFDLFVSVGGPGVGKATVSVEINSNNVIGDDFWIWRADHGNGVGWNSNTGQNGIVVNGNNVTIYGLAVEHYQQYQTVWNGNGGSTYFYQSEAPYDPPSQGAWSSGSGRLGWASYKVSDTVTTHSAYGVGVYSFFSNGGLHLGSGIEAPASGLNGAMFHDMMTFSGGGRVDHIINSFGGSGGAQYLAQ